MRIVSKEARSISPSEYIDMARRWWPLVVIPLLAALGVYWYSSRQAPVYRASTILLVPPKSESFNAVMAARLMAETYDKLATSPLILEDVIVELGLPLTPPELAMWVDARAIRPASLVEISARHKDPGTAADIAGATGDALSSWIEEQEKTVFDEQVRRLEDNIDQAEADLERTSQALEALSAKPTPRSSEDEAQIGRLTREQRQHERRLTRLRNTRRGLQFTPEQHLELVSPAQPPATPHAPRPIRDAALTFGLGLALAVTYVIVVERVTQRFREPQRDHIDVEPSVLRSASPLD